MSINHEFTFPRSSSPTKSNAHPYSIKTTSTALLSRSNSTSNNHNTSHHHYVPQTPPSSSPKQRKHSGQHRHRYSSSLSMDNIPRPLPVPPQSPSILETSPLLTLEDLPTNPKLWTPSQLCTYLSSALRVKSGESMLLPPQVARDIAVFVRESRITGKIFLRLDDPVLEAYGVNKLWKSALLRASQTLRQNVLKGQIWGFGNQIEGHFPSSPSEDTVGIDDDGNDSTPHRRRRSASQPQPPFPNGLPEYSSASSSSSTEDLFSTTGSMISSAISPSRHSHSHVPTHTGKHRNGRVKGMVDSFERSSSFDEGDPTSVKQYQEIRGLRELDLERLRKLRRERSGSTSSGSSHSPTSSSDDGRTHSPLEGEEEEEERYNVSTITSSPSRPLPTPPPSSSPSPHTLEEPSIEDLLAQQKQQPNSSSSLPNIPALPSTSYSYSKAHSLGLSKGAFSISKGKGKAKKRGGVYAWEAEVDDGDGNGGPGKATAKRMPSQVQVPNSVKRSLRLTSKSKSSARDIFIKGDPDPNPSSNDNDNESSVQASSSTSGGGIIGEESTTGKILTGTHTPSSSSSSSSSRPLPTIPIHPSLISLLDIDGDPESEPKSESAFKDLDTAELPVNTVLDTDLDTNMNTYIKTSIDTHTDTNTDTVTVKQLLAGFQARLGEVERKVDVLEGEVRELQRERERAEEEARVKVKVNAEAEAERQREMEREREKEKAKEEEEAKIPTSIPSEWPDTGTVVRKVLSNLGLFPYSSPSSHTSSQSTTSNDSGRPRRKYWNPDPQTLSQLPPYVLLVGLGVCAVVLRVVAKRLAGGGRR